ncbi:hypothetical protein ACO0QE_002306 [Hanseniaspora vineae]
MVKEFCIAFVGKPSAGKSTSLNALCLIDAHEKFKTGNYPFTTLEAAEGTGFVKVPCKCQDPAVKDLLTKQGVDLKTVQCKPNYGWCEDGIRNIPIKLLDIPGLIPDAHLGHGLGNKFLDSLRKADALVHCVDISGTTNEKGEACRAYDPINDVDWLVDEIKYWIFNNLKNRWGSIVRRHTASKSTTVETLSQQFGGYSANLSMVQKALDKFKDSELPPLQEWNDEWILKVIEKFMSVKFPMVLALNKIDHQDADKNISKVMLKYGSKYKIVLTSAVTEVFLKKLKYQGFIKYEEGTEFVDTYEDDNTLKPLPENIIERIENIRDLVLYRFGSTGVSNVLKTAACDTLDLMPVYTVKNINNFSNELSATSNNSKNIFRDCFLVKKGSKVGDIKRHLFGIEVSIGAIMTVNNVRVGEDDVIMPGKNDILSFKLAPKAL